MKEKSFVNFRHNGIHFNFPNGNRISAIWGWGSHTENYGSFDNDPIQAINTFMESNTVELLISCGEKLHKKLMNKFDGDGTLLNNMNMTDFIYVFDKISKEKKDQNDK